MGNKLFFKVKTLTFLSSLLFISLNLTACSTNTILTKQTKCPDIPIDALASISQWGSLVKQVGGQCVNVNSIISSTNVEPHDYEPTANDIGKFSQSKLIIINGANYDQWALKAAEQSNINPQIINIAKINNLKDGDNPHLFYSISAIKKTIKTITNQLINLNRNLSDYFTQNSLIIAKSYNDLQTKITQTKTKLNNKKVLVTESVADYLLNELGLINITPKGYLQSASNEGEISANDINQYTKLLEGKQADLLVENIQEQNNTTDKLISIATANKIKIVQVTEQIPEQYTTINLWLDNIVDQIASS
ncbi:MAG: zinc ABC transporter substrate-binding protein [Bifidobacteriaceae bacterium]|jgi:zinc/manganese transport system substrate-binding protein|nr:zinc ABC transporter substrate-binding protein [Bifidobacteriaceae bacterium]